MAEATYKTVSLVHAYRCRGLQFVAAVAGSLAAGKDSTGTYILSDKHEAEIVNWEYVSFLKPHIQWHTSSNKGIQPGLS